MEKKDKIVMSLKCLLIAGAIIGAGYYVYKHKARFKLG